MFKNLKLTCNEATTICNKNQYGEASIKDLIKLNIHFITCRVCALYTKQNMKLSRFYKGYSKRCKAIKNCMTLEEKKELKKALEENK